jgi:carbonic anhydrase/acetyltransferase-like protein (isoleucine patch superfamily)
MNHVFCYMTMVNFLNKQHREVSMAIHSLAGQQPTMGLRVMVAETSFIIGEVTLGDDVSVWPGAVIRGDMHRIVVGERTSIQDGAVLHITHASDYNTDGFPLIIGSDVTIGHQACLHGCTIGNEVLIGIAATILDGAVIEDRVMVAAGALVPPGKRLVSGYMYLGSPVRQARALTDKELSFFKYSAKNYTKLKNQYIAEGLSEV